MLSVYLKKIVRFIYILIIGNVSSEAFGGIPTIWHAPSKNPSFIGRKETLEAIALIFKDAQIKIAVLAGPSGFGKSQIAKYYLHDNYAKYDIVWWFKGNQYLQPQLENFAQALDSTPNLELGDKTKSVGQAKLVELIKDAIRKKGLKCLIIFDDVQAYSDIKPYIPFTHENNVHTIVTTKNARFSADAIQVKAFTLEECLEYISRFLPEVEKDIKKKLAIHRAGCPLSIAIAMDYIKCSGMTIDGYLDKYESELSLSPHLVKDAAEKLGSSIDGYKMDLYNAIKMNLDEIKNKSKKAYKLVGFLSLLHHDAICSDNVNSWMNTMGEKGDVEELISVVNQYSLIDNITTEGKVYFRMNELIQKIVNVLIPVEEKKKHIEQAVKVLENAFGERTDKNVESVLKNNEAFLHTLSVSEEAHKIGYHSPNLTSLRVKVLDVLVGIIRDWDKAKLVKSHIESDLEQGITLKRVDDIIFNTNLFLFSFIYAPDFDKAIGFGKRALTLINEEEGMPEEKVRLFSNLIQYYCFIGVLDEAQKYIEEGDKYLSLSKSDAYNALYVLAQATYLNDRGEFDKVVNLVRSNQPLLERQEAYPSMYSFTLNQLCHALILSGNIEEGKKSIILTEKIGRNFYDSEDNHFFARLIALKAMSQFSQPELFESSKELLEKSLQTYEKVYCGSDKHKIQGFVNLMLGKLYYINKDHAKAKVYALKAENIYKTVTKGKEYYDLSELYKLMALIGVDTREESVTKVYLKNLIDTFGIDHPRTYETILYLDQKGLRLPF